MGQLRGFTQKDISILPIFVTVFIDLVGLGIIIPVLAPLFLDPSYGLLPPAYSTSTRTILLGLLISSYPFAQFFGAPLLGGLSDRYGRKKILLLSLLGTCIGYLFFALGIGTKNLVLLFISRSLDGFTGGNISIAMSAIADISSKEAKAKNFGLVGMAFGLGFILGPYIGGNLADPHVVAWFTFATPFWFAALLTLANILLVILQFPETLTARVHSKIGLMTGFKNLAKAFSLTNLRTMFTVVFLLSFGFTLFSQFFQVFLIAKFKFSQTQIGNLFAFIGIFIALTQGGLTRVIARKFSPPQVLSYSIVLLSLTFPMLLLPRNPLWLYSILPFVAIFNGLTQPNATSIISNLSSKESQGEILGINQSIQSLAFALPPIVAGLLAAIDPTLPLIIASAITFLAWLTFMLFFKERKREMFVEV